jgi:uncharacterized protein (DUF952 family)/N-acetylglutamate synthase-like GNAT family acetyltransferase
MTLLHIVRPGEWDGRQIDPGPEGFVHLSRPDQVHVPVARFYAEATDLALLVVAERRLTSTVRVEQGFPHLYGPLHADAVVEVVPYDGRMAWVPTDPDDEPAAALLEADEAELAELYGAVTVQPREQLRPPDGDFLVGWLDGEPVACGGLRRHDEHRGEIRRMYVVPAARSRGVGRALLAAVEGAAARLGYPVVVLDTGPKQPHAELLYRSAGYAEIDPYRPESNASFFGEKSVRP